MESLIANDWLQEYGTLFEAFDNEMGAGQVTSSDYFNEYDLNNCYNTSYKDELSLILGLDWMPNIELNSPDSSSTSVSPGCSSASSSSAPSPAAVPSSPPFVAPPPPLIHHPAAPLTSACVTVKKQTMSGPLSPPISCSSPATITKSTTVISLEDATAPAADSQNSNSCYSPSFGSSLKKRKKCPRMKGTSLLAPSAATASPLKMASSTSSSNGSSILHHSSGSGNSISPTTIISPVATPLSTLVTFSSNTNRLASATITTSTQQTAATIPSSLTAQNLTTLASSKPISTNITTTTTNNHFSPKRLNLITSSGKQPLLQLQLQQKQQQTQPHQQQPLIFLSTRTNLTTLDKAVRYCVKIEHAYSLS